jgi:hypothetical protein
MDLPAPTPDLAQPNLPVQPANRPMASSGSNASMGLFIFYISSLK